MKEQTERPAALSDERIREVFLANGFRIKDGQNDLKPYVYVAARALLDAAVIKESLSAVPSAPAVADANALAPAPPNSLPTWSDCKQRVENSDFLATQELYGGYGPKDSDCPQATNLHRFIYAYDDADPISSGWFLHRLELALKEAVAAPAVADAPISDEQTKLMTFYGVTTLVELVAQQAHHIERLQAKLPKTPSLVPQRVREG